jgi:peptidoglycan hydrolase-like protein with peptidoglycan-binding domain
MALKRVSIPSPNYSSRGGSKVRLIVLHTAEGATTYQSLGNYFANPSSQVSSHVGIDDTANTVGQYVQRPNKAWTAANANPYSVQAELCAFAKWGASDWSKHQTMLKTTAAWVAEEAAAFGIPIVKLTAGQAQGGSSGVCQHADLGSAGGGHWDCGGSFPIDDVIRMAKGGSSSSGGSPPPAQGGTKAPAFPYPSSHYLGRPDSTDKWHDGHGHGQDSTHVLAWQQQMAFRGWDIDPDGVYGPASEDVAEAFQREKGLTVDGKVGPQTWATSWTAPIT